MPSEEGVPGTRIFGGRTRWKALAGLMFVLPSIRAISFAGPPSSLRFTAFPKARHSLTRTGPSTGSLFPKILTFPAPLPPAQLAFGAGPSVFGAGPTQYGAGPKKGAGPAPQINLLCVPVEQVPTKNTDLHQRGLSSTSPVRGHFKVRGKIVYLHNFDN